MVDAQSIYDLVKQHMQDEVTRGLQEAFATLFPSNSSANSKVINDAGDSFLKIAGPGICEAITQAIIYAISNLKLEGTIMVGGKIGKIKSNSVPTVNGKMINTLVNKYDETYSEGEFKHKEIDHTC